MNYTLELTDELMITEGSLERSGNNISLSFSEAMSIAVVLDSTYKIKRAADTAYMRTNYP